MHIPLRDPKPAESTVAGADSSPLPPEAEAQASAHPFLQIVNHAVEEVLEHTGLGGEIKHQSDASAHDRASGWLNDAQRIQSEARALLASQPNEDLETAIKALTIATGSLEEVVERYE